MTPTKNNPGVKHRTPQPNKKKLPAYAARCITLMCTPHQAAAPQSWALECHNNHLVHSNVGDAVRPGPTRMCHGQNQHQPAFVVNNTTTHSSITCEIWMQRHAGAAFHSPCLSYTCSAPKPAMPSIVASVQDCMHKANTPQLTTLCCCHCCCCRSCVAAVRLPLSPLLLLPMLPPSLPHPPPPTCPRKLSTGT